MSVAAIGADIVNGDDNGEVLLKSAEEQFAIDCVAPIKAMLKSLAEVEGQLMQAVSRGEKQKEGGCRSTCCNQEK